MEKSWNFVFEFLWEPWLMDVRTDGRTLERIFF